MHDKNIVEFALTFSPHSWNILLTILLFLTHAETTISSISRTLWMLACISAMKPVKN